MARVRVLLGLLMRILVCDDDHATREILGAQLTARGHTVTEACDGTDALERLAADHDISVLITDWLMPRMDGPTLCREVRRLQRPRYLFVILLTSKSQRADLIAGLNAGADAFISKPMDFAEIDAHLRTAARILDLERQLEGRITELERAQEHIRKDLSAAAAVQRSLLPERGAAFAGLETAWVYDSCEEVAGDMFNVQRLDEESVGVYILDVCGHGVPAALLSVTLSRILTPHPQQGGVLKRLARGGQRYELVAPAAVAEELNRRFPALDDPGHYFSFLYGVLNVRSRVFRYVRAGHPGPIWIHGGRATVHNEPGGVAIGLGAETAYSEGILDLGAGDILLFHTDGLNEAVSATGERFGMERVTGTLAACSDLGVDAAVGGLMTALRAFCGATRLQDDVTVVGLGLL